MKKTMTERGSFRFVVDRHVAIAFTQKFIGFDGVFFSAGLAVGRGFTISKVRLVYRIHFKDISQITQGSLPFLPPITMEVKNRCISK